MAFLGSLGSGLWWPARSSATWLELPDTGFWWQLTQLVALYTGPSPSEIVSTSSHVSRSSSKASWSSNPLVELLKPVGASSGLSVALSWGAAWDPLGGLLAPNPNRHGKHQGHTTNAKSPVSQLHGGLGRRPANQSQTRHGNTSSGRVWKRPETSCIGNSPQQSSIHREPEAVAHTPRIRPQWNGWLYRDWKSPNFRSSRRRNCAGC